MEFDGAHPRWRQQGLTDSAEHLLGGAARPRPPRIGQGSLGPGTRRRIQHRTGHHLPGSACAHRRRDRPRVPPRRRDDLPGMRTGVPRSPGVPGLRANPGITPAVAHPPFSAAPAGRLRRRRILRAGVLSDPNSVGASPSRGRAPARRSGAPPRRRGAELRDRGRIRCARRRSPSQNSGVPGTDPPVFVTVAGRGFEVGGNGLEASRRCRRPAHLFSFRPYTRPSCAAASPGQYSVDVSDRGVLVADVAERTPGST